MSVNALPVQSRHPHLRLVRSSLSPMAPPETDAGWRRVAAAILTSTWNVSRFLHEQRWGRVHEEISERRELLGFMRSLPLDATGGRHCAPSTRQRSSRNAPSPR